MSNLQEEQQSIDSRIVCELVEIIPDTWNDAILQIEYVKNGETESYSHTIKNPEGASISAFPSDALYLATRELSIVFRKYGYQWKKVIYTISLLPDGDWSYKANFEY
jgi:hypothetical protein